MASSTYARQLFILDGMALAYRAFYAFISSPMRSSKGVNTSAIFGFANTLASILDKEKPSHLVACFDAGHDTLRRRLYPEYKANRQVMPDELRISIPPILRILEQMNIPIVRMEGYEADDLIGTLTKLAESDPNMECFMVTLDKDLGQLLSPRCRMWKPGKRNTEHEVIDCDRFNETWGIEHPEQIIDILALMGDASDNIPGVPGVGEKTAKTLVAEFGSVENLLAHTDQLKGKRRTLIEENADKARLSKTLATIVRDIPLDISLEDCIRRSFDTETLRKTLLEYDLKTPAERLCGKGQPKEEPFGDLFGFKATNFPVPPSFDEGSEQMLLFEQPEMQTLDSTEHRYKTARTPEERNSLAKKLLAASSWSFDTETTGKDPLCDSLLGISFALSPFEAWYVPIHTESDLEPFREVFLSPAEKIGHNLKFDLEVLYNSGLKTCGPFFDTMLAHSALEPDQRHNMDDMAENLLHYRTIRLEEIAGEEIDTTSVPEDVMAQYAAEDADVTLRLANVVRKKLREKGCEKLMIDVEFPLIPVLASIEEAGMRIDPEALKKSSDEMEERLYDLIERINATVGRPINLNSPKQLGELLFGEMKLMSKPKKTKTGQYVTDEKTLKKLAPSSPLVTDILEYREAAKLKSTYLDALPKYISPRDGRIHTTLMQMVTATGRLASQSPNLQNIPIRTEAGQLIRRAFIPENDQFTLLSADYSQVELRIMAALSGDPHLIEAFCENRDIHTETAARVFHIERDQVDRTMRRAAKAVNFGIIYGISAFGLSERLGCSRGEATQLIENYFKEFSGVKSYMESLTEHASKLGYAETLYGRRRYLPDLQSANHNLRMAAERTAINTPIQGTAADMIKLAMVRVDTLLKKRRSRMIMQIHDELLIELAQGEEDLVQQVTEAMLHALPLPNGVPLSVEANTGENWLAAH